MASNWIKSPAPNRTGHTFTPAQRKALGVAVQLRREELGLSLGELSDRAYVHTDIVARIERGGLVTLFTLRRVQDSLDEGSDPDWLLGEVPHDQH